MVCRGYLPVDINTLFPNTDTIDGRKVQLIELAAAHNDGEAMRVLEDWSRVLHTKSFTVTGELDMRKETDPAPRRYAICDVVLCPHRKHSMSQGFQFGLTK